MHLFARQGDLVIAKLAEKPSGEFEAVKDFSFAGDSSGHPHVLKGPAKISRGTGVTLVIVSKATILEHRKAGGHKPIKMPAGSYSVRILRERGGVGDREVAD